MDEADTLLNVGAATLAKALKIEVDQKTVKNVLQAVDACKDVIVLHHNFYRSTEYAVALANHWAHHRREDTAVFFATDWQRYTRKNLAPCDPFESFKEFLFEPLLLLISGLSYVAFPKHRQEIDEALHRRAMRGRPTMIAGWNMPAHTFRFEANQELATDTTSMYPMLHSRCGLDDRVYVVEVPNG